MNTQTLTDNADFQTAAVETLMHGEWVRRLNSDGSMQSKTYQRSTYDRATKRYSLVDCDDASREVWVKKGAKLAIGFSY